MLTHKYELCELHVDIRIAGKTDESRWWLDKCGNNWWNRKDCYDFDVLYYVERGKFQLKVDNIPYILSAGQIAYIPAGKALEYAVLEDAPLVKYYIHFYAKMSGCQPIISFGPENILTIPDKHLLENLQLLCSGFTETQAGLFRLHGALMQVLGDFFQHYSGAVKVDSNDTIAAAFAYITEHYREKISVEQLAKQSGFSRDYFSKKFAERYGCSPTKCLTNLRIRQARYLLTETQLPVSQVAVAVGIGDNNYFSRLFKQLVGLYPQKYRYMYRAGRLEATKERAEASVPVSVR